MIEKSLGCSGYTIMNKNDGNWLELWNNSGSIMINFYELEEAKQFIADLKKEWQLNDPN